MTEATPTQPAPTKTAPKKRSMLAGYLVPGVPHVLLASDRNPGWRRVRQAMDKLAVEIEKLNPDVLVIYSTYWASVIGHQIQALPEPEFTLVDDLFHDLGSMPYKFRIDSDYAKAACDEAKSKGLHARTVAYKGFPIDTGSVVAMKLLNPKNKFPAVMVSSNIYADRAETVVLGKACADALKASGKKAVAVVVSSLSNRLLEMDFDPAKDAIHSKKDDEWNRKVLQYLELGRLEDVSQLSRQIHREARVQKVNNFKAFWWLSAFMGQNNLYTGEVLAYEAIQGTGAAVVGLTPAEKASRDLEYDEEDPEFYPGERNVL